MDMSCDLDIMKIRKVKDILLNATIPEKLKKLITNYINGGKEYNNIFLCTIIESKQKMFPVVVPLGGSFHYISSTFTCKGKK